MDVFLLVRQVQYGGRSPPGFDPAEGEIPKLEGNQSFNKLILLLKVTK